MVYDVHCRTNTLQLHFFGPTLFFLDGAERQDGGETLLVDEEAELKLDDYIHRLEGIKEGESMEF